MSDDPVYSLGPEWRAYDSEEEKMRSRNGDPLSLLQADLGVHSKISNSKIDSRGNVLSAEKQRHYYRLSQVNNQSLESKVRNLKQALREIKRLKSQLQITVQNAELASIYYRKVLQANLIRGRSIIGMAAACIYLACRKTKTPLTLKDLQEATDLSIKELGRCVRIVLKLLEKEENTNKDQKTAYPALILKLGQNLEMSMPTIKIAIKISEEARKHGLTIGKNPMSIAAASLYIAGVYTGERRTQSQIARAAKTTPVTIRNRFKEIIGVLNLDDLEVKRGAAAIPVYIDDPRKLSRTEL